MGHAPRAGGRSPSGSHSYSFDEESDYNEFDQTFAPNNVVGFLIFGNHNKVGKLQGGGILSNTANNNSLFGFWVTGDDNHFKSDSASGNTGEGYRIDGNLNTFLQTIAIGNGDGYLFLGDDNKAIMNTAVNNPGAGIGVSGQKNHFIQNGATGNGVVDLLEFNKKCDKNTWMNNTFGTSQDPDDSPSKSRGEPLGRSVSVRPWLSAGIGGLCLLSPRPRLSAILASGLARLPRSSPLLPLDGR